ncbi:MAG: efflux RND transporter periplasmic adaptor subunit [Rhodopila sp.]|nr:efflux RND transporter periplasmic adaptor subunit [Rhodopila sp.]
MDALTREPVRTRARSRLRGWGVTLLCLLVVAAIGWAIWFFPSAAPSTKGRDRDAGQAIPVLAAVAATKDVPVYLDGLGTVQAFNTVTMKAMVDGPLLSVNFKEGQDVHKGDVLAQIDPRTYQAALDNATAKKAQDEAQLANARLDLARYQKLVANNYTSAQQADTSKAQVAQFQALVQQDQAQIDTARTQLSYTTIVAPIDGRTGIRQLDAGNIVHAADPIGMVVITQLQPISVLFTLPQQTLPAVARALAAGRATALAQDATGGASRLLDTGALTVLDNQVDSTTGTIKLKATFPNAQSRLWPGGFVNVRLQVDVAKDAVVVPPAAIQRGPRGAYVFVIGDGDTAKRQAVTVGYEDEQASVVTAGLKGGEKVVIDGASRLSDGSKVSLAKPDAEAATGPGQPTAPGTSRQRQ